MSDPSYPYKGSFRITSGYGYRIDPLTGESGTWHGGLDLVGEDKYVISVSSGMVIRSRIVLDESDRTSEWGSYIAVQADSGEVIYYCHLAERLVESGERISAGQIIGIEGSTGKSTGSHLHFEVRRDGNQVNAAEYLGIPNTAGYVYVPEVEENVGDNSTVDTSADDTSAVDTSASDSIPHDWAEDAVRWAVSSGILQGNEHGDLKLHSSCTREEAVVFLFRLHNLISEQIKGEKS